MTESYRPRHICHAFRIEAPTLRGWHNQHGLTVGNLGSTGRRVYDLAAAAAVGFVARATGMDGTRGYLTLFAAVDIANKAAPHLAALSNGYRAAFGVNMLPEMGRRRPLILFDQLGSGAWEVVAHDTLGSALMRMTDLRPALLTLDPANLLQRALLVLPAQAYEEGYSTGKAGRSGTDHRFTPGTPVHQKFYEGWCDGQAVLADMLGQPIPTDGTYLKPAKKEKATPAKKKGTTTAPTAAPRGRGRRAASTVN